LDERNGMRIFLLFKGLLPFRRWHDLLGLAWLGAQCSNWLAVSRL